MRNTAALIVLLLTFMGASASRADDLGLTPAQERKLSALPPDQQTKICAALSLNHSLHKLTGDVQLPAAQVTLHLSDKFYYLPAEDARKVIVEGWGNPPASAADTLGMIFPASSSWLDDDGWGANITFDKVGYVASVQHSQSDYDQVDRQMRDAEPAANQEREKINALPIHYVGWAQPPSYDDIDHTAIWARELAFGQAKINTLNYDIRTLGRTGVLSMNIISVMPQLPAVRAAANQLRSITSFYPGAQYSDYHAGDKKAAYGVAGLIAAGAGLVVAKKIGLLGIMLLFGKKAAVLLIAAFAAVAGWFRRLFGRDKKASPSAKTASPNEVMLNDLPEQKSPPSGEKLRDT